MDVVETRTFVIPRNARNPDDIKDLMEALTEFRVQVKVDEFDNIIVVKATRIDKWL